MSNELEKALERLAGLYEFGSLELATFQADFMNKVCDEIELLRSPDKAFRLVLKDSALQLREELSDLMHQIWAHWTQYMLFSLGLVDPDASQQRVEKECVRRWLRQIKTPYSALSERERDSDREQADKVLTLLAGLSEKNVKCASCGKPGAFLEGQDGKLCPGCWYGQGMDSIVEARGTKVDD